MGFDASGVTVFMVSPPQARYPAAQVIATHERLDEQFAAMPGVSQVCVFRLLLSQRECPQLHAS